MGQDATPGVRVFLIDDHAAMRNGLSLLLAQVGHTICGEAGSREEVLARIDAALPDVALVDLSLAEESGLDLIDELRSRSIPALIYSMHEDCATIERAFDCGASGYATKREVADVLLEAIAEVAAGRRYVSPRAMRSLASRVLLSGEGMAVVLSQREEQIMAMLGHGETSAEIAKALQISAHTVQTYYARIIEKFDLGGMKDLRKLAIRQRK
jgi:DNA-binding NarL/FixJ family response regulator